MGYALTPFHLQTIGAVVFEVVRLQHALKGVEQFASAYKLFRHV